MDSRSRMLKAWSFQEPDRVPLEIYLYPPAKGLPGADRILDFQETEADNFRGVPGFNWGFMGLDTTYAEEVIEDVPGDQLHVHLRARLRRGQERGRGRSRKCDQSLRPRRDALHVLGHGGRPRRSADT